MDYTEAGFSYCRQLAACDLRTVFCADAELVVDRPNDDLTFKGGRGDPYYNFNLSDQQPYFTAATKCLPLPVVKGA